MQLHTLLLDLFASITLISATMVIVSTNPIHSVVYLILVFCNAAGLLILLKIEFIAMMFLIIYVGAIAVLFLFVVMMLNIKVNELSENWLRYLPIGGIISAIFLLEMTLLVAMPLDSDYVPTPPLSGSGSSMSLENYLGWLTENESLGTTCSNNIAMNQLNLHYDYYFTFLTPDINQRNWPSLIDSLTNIESLGYLIYTYYFYYFLMASIILLIAMIGAIVLTMHKRKNASKKQLIYKQISRNFSTAVGYSSI